mmetsp:Transcript_23409/g.44054  ORF Transcript_23409/g.44054 Transcript_23409/m.44054 type:complete len:134 (+) Transcript_23409:14-415(+)
MQLWRPHGKFCYQTEGVRTGAFSAPEAMASAGQEGHEGGDDDNDVEVEHGYLIHVGNLPSSCSLSDVSALLTGAGFNPGLSYRVSDSVVAVSLSSEGEVQSSLRLNGVVLTPPPVGNVKMPGQSISVTPVSDA